MVDIVQQSSLSYDSIKTDLTNYVQSLSDYDLRWKDFYFGSAGVILIELIASMAAYLNLVALKSRREAYIDEAKLTSSIYGIATTLGYDVNRATSPSYSINVTCLNPVSQKKEVPIGTYNSTPISLIEDTTLLAGNNDLEVLLGTWSNFSANSTTSAAYARFLIQDNIDNNLYKLYVNNVEVPTVRAAELLDSTNVLLRTYFTGMYIVFGDGIFGKQLNIDDQISFDYFIPAPISQDSSFSLSNTSCNIGAINYGNVITYGSSQDSNAKIAVVAPGYYTAKRRLVTYSDYKNVALGYNGIISTNVQKHPGVCCTIDLAVIAENGRTLNDSENQALLTYMNDFQVIGTNINLVAPISTNVSVKMIVVIQAVASQATITSTINNYLNSMTYTLGQFFSISGALNLYLPGVIGIYPQYPIIDRQAAYNEFFVLTDLDIEYTTTVTGIKSFGADNTIGYS